MNIKIKEKDIELKFTFNSFRYMEEFDIGALEEIENKPFKMAGIAKDLLYGAVNNSPLCRFTELEVSEFLEDYIKTESLIELTETLMEELQKSDFFKSLQKTTKPVKAKK